MQHLRGESQGGAAAGKPVTGTARLQAPDHRAGRHAEGHQQDRELDYLATALNTTINHLLGKE